MYRLPEPMRAKKRAFIFLLFVFCAFYTWSQEYRSGTLSFEGVVYGYNHDPSKKFLKKSKQFVMEGLLNRANIDVYHEGNLVYTDKTNAKGEFSIPLPFDGVFKLELSKDGYDKSILIIDTRNVPEEKLHTGLAFTGAEFMLNSYKSKAVVTPEYMGILYYDFQNEYFDFFASEKEVKKQDNSIALLRKAVIKNKTPSFFPQSFDASVAKPAFSRKDTSAATGKTKKHRMGFDLNPAGIKNITMDNIALRKNEIGRARKQLEADKLYAVSAEDSIVINAREAIIRAAETELQNALTLIEAQKSEIQHKKRELYIMLGLLLLFAGLAVIAYVYYREKKYTSFLLETKNRNILDSIAYAKRIQQSILINEEEIKNVLPDFFIYNRPKDIVSGDFCWFSDINGKLVVAVVDCTGHGVPGAFMSLIANTLLNEIVNEKCITEPALILQELHQSITDALHQEKENSKSFDGMDMTLCVIDKKNKKIKYAGAINPLYIVQDGALKMLKADMRSIGGRRPRAQTARTPEFTSHTLTIKKEITLYMFSDGYVDQFGGPNAIAPFGNGNVAKKKFGTEKFRQLLLNIHAQDMNRQKEIVHNTMNQWRGNCKQIDDMLVVGIRIKAP